jgi:hypothetical protein
VIVSAHQPHYLPWIGYLAKVAASDLFVVMDDLQFEAQNFQNRNRLKLNHGPAWLTVPLEHGGQQERICDKRIRHCAHGRHHWQWCHWETMRIHYGGARYWERYRPALEAVYQQSWSRLLDLNLHLLRLHLEWLDIRTPLVLASELALTGQKTERITALCRAVSADVYLSGSGGSRGYLDVAELERAGVRVAWQSIRHPVYRQRYGGRGFVSHLAALDMLLNCGPDSKQLLRAAMEAIGEQPLREASQ